MKMRGWSSVMSVAVSLFILSPLVLVNINGQINPECFQFIGGPFVVASTIVHELTTLQMESNGTVMWSNRLNASWAKPSDSYVGSYVLFLEVIPTELSSLPDCPIQPSDVVVNETMFIKDDLPFGFNFRLTVQTTNEMSTIRNILSNSAAFFSTNDCYLETMDVAFCSSRPNETQYVGTAYDLRIDSIYPNVTNTKALLANVSWLPPLQLNPEYVLNGYRVTFMKTAQSISITVGSIPHNDEEGKDFRYSTLVTGLQGNESYTLKIVAFVSNDGATELGQFSEITFSTPAAVDAPTTAIPSGTKEITTEVVHHANRITSADHETSNTQYSSYTSHSYSSYEEDDSEKIVVLAVIIAALLVIFGSVGFACFIANVKQEEKQDEVIVVEEQKMDSVRKTGNEYS